jgi:hypothetical protein
MRPRELVLLHGQPGSAADRQQLARPTPAAGAAGSGVGRAPAQPQPGNSAVFCLVYGFSNAESHAWSAGLTIAAFTANAVLLASFVIIEHRAETGPSPLSLPADAALITCGRTGQVRTGRAADANSADMFVSHSR